MPEILDVHDILALKMSHASTVTMNDRQKPQNFQNKLNPQQRRVNFVNHLDRIQVLAILCPVKSKVMGAKLTQISETLFEDEMDEAANETNIPINRRVSYGETAKRASFSLGNKEIT